MTGWQRCDLILQTIDGALASIDVRPQRRSDTSPAAAPASDPSGTLIRRGTVQKPLRNQTS